MKACVTPGCKNTAKPHCRECHTCISRRYRAKHRSVVVPKLPSEPDFEITEAPPALVGNIGNPVFCEHANENPYHCACKPHCYCRSFTCKNKAPSATTLPTMPPDPLETARSAYRESKARRDIHREHSALLRENERLSTALEEIYKLNRPYEHIVYDRAKDLRVDAVAVGVASDWHVEEGVDPTTVHGLNEYNLDVARERARMFFQNLLKLAEITARDSHIRTIFLALLGDFFTGFIHEEMLAGNLLAPGDAATFCRDLLCSGIDYLLREGKFDVDIVAIPGNHGRMTKQMWFSNPTGTSLETVMYRWIASRYEGNPRVRMLVSNRAMVYQKFFESFTMRLIHGYEIKYQGGVGGLTIPALKAIGQWDLAKRADLTVFGHWHQRLDLDRFSSNGSLIGYTPYSQQIKAAFARPVQSFFLVDARHGGEKTLSAPIWVEL